MPVLKSQENYKVLKSHIGISYRFHYKLSFIQTLKYWHELGHL